MAFIADAPCAKCNLHHYNVRVEYDEPASDGGDWYVAIGEPDTCECGEPMKYVHVPLPSYYSILERNDEANRKVPG